MIDGEDCFLREQLEFLTDTTYNYTGSGMFVSFSFDKNIDRKQYSESTRILNGVKIETTEYPIEAEAILFLKNEIIDCLEIWCYFGDYPNQDLTKYTLTQSWKNSPNRQIKKPE
jgi:hypothetical protein